MKKKYRVLSVVLATICILSSSIVVYAVHNAPQYPEGLPEMGLDKTTYAASPSQETTTLSDIGPVAKSAEPAQTKEEIYDRMLNSVDYYNTAEVCFDLFDNCGLGLTCQIETNLLTGESYEAVAPLSAGAKEVDSNLSDIESYADGALVTAYYNTNRTYAVSHPVVARRMCEDELDESQPRAFINSEDEMPCYVYRADSTNTTYGSNCLFPQGITFGYLSDFNLWEIEGSETYLDRDCLVISGITTGSYKTKTGVSTFTMYVDSKTGILLKLKGLAESGNIARSMTVNAISVDGPMTYSMCSPDMSKYADYTKLDY